MEEEAVWEGAKTAAMYVGGIIFAFAALILLDFYGLVDIGVEIDPTLLTFLFGALLATGLAAFFIDNMDWI